MKRPAFPWRLALGVAVFCVVVATSAPARAHGGLWRAYDVLFEPGNPDHIVLRSDVWGIVRSLDAGSTWSWLCAEAYAGSSLQTQRRSVAILPGGTLFVANLFDGLQVSSVDGCEFRSMEQFDGGLTQDVLASADFDTLYVLSVTTSGVDANTSSMWESGDAGATWLKLGASLPAGFIGTSMKVAPSEPARFYVAGKTIGSTNSASIFRTSDAGAGWAEIAMPMVTENWTARVAGIDPRDAEAVYFWLDRNEGGGGDVQPDSIWHSPDAGDTWIQVFDAVGNLPGFAFSPDGATVLVGGPEDGVHGAATDAVAVDGAAAFSAVEPLRRVWGLNWTEAGLFAGVDDFPDGPTTPFSLGVSVDRGATFEPLLEICDVDMIPCAADTATSAACGPMFEGRNSAAGFTQDYLDSDRCSDAGAAPQASSGDPPDVDGGFERVEGGGRGPENGGRGCHLSVARPSPAGLIPLAVLAVVGLVRRRTDTRRRSLSRTSCGS